MREVKFIYLSGLMLFCLTAWSQDNRYMPNIISPPPDVAGLIKYAELPVDNYSGTARFDIPLYQLQQGDISLPISLSYYSNGLKVEDEASWVGLNWSLNAGGVIQHITNGEDNISRDIIPFNVASTGTNYEYGDFTTNCLERGCQFLNEAGETVYVSELSNFINNGYQYNLYIYNFAGYSGKYIKDIHNNYVTLDKNNIRFEDLAEGNGFKATTTDGTQYFFAVRGSTATPNLIEGPCATNQYSTVSISYSYYLTKIVSPTNNEVNLSYVQLQTSSVPSFSQWRTELSLGYDTPKFISVRSDYTSYMLREINTTNIKVKFTQGSRIDITNGEKLNSIEIFPKQNGVTSGTSIKAIAFNYDYFTGDASFGDYYAPNTSSSWGCGRLALPAPTVNEKSKRLKLLSVYLSDRLTATTERTGYTFQYDITPLPYKTSLGKDIWGYFNGYNNSSLLPNVNTLGYVDGTIPAIFFQNPSPGNRSASATHPKAGMLTSIRQPTGGTTYIEYETNQFGQLDTASQSTWTEVIVQDFGSTAGLVEEFDIVNLPNHYEKLTVELMCNAVTGGCDDGINMNGTQLCEGYETSPWLTHPNDTRLYALLEKSNPDGSWSMVKQYSRISPELLASAANIYRCGIYNVNIVLEPGHYRIRANYPDDMQNTGIVGGPWARIGLSYQVPIPISQITAINGAGLRIKSVEEHESTTNRYTIKKYTYTTGLLLTNPVFYRKMSREALLSNTQHYTYNENCPALITDPEILQCMGTNTNMEIGINIISQTLYSDPLIPFSYNANGGLVGYNEVTVTYGAAEHNSNPLPNNYIGKEVYRYKNQADNLFYYNSISPGIPGSRRLDNGALLEKTTYKITAATTASATYQPVKKETYEYEVMGFKNYWAFKTERVPIQVICGASGVVSVYQGMNDIFVHFYPVKTGKVTLKKRTDTEYSLSADEEPIISGSRTTNYLYNSKFQLAEQNYIDSKNQLVQQKSFYAGDLSSGSQQSQMQ